MFSIRWQVWCRELEVLNKVEIMLIWTNYDSNFLIVWMSFRLYASRLIKSSSSCAFFSSRSHNIIYFPISHHHQAFFFINSLENPPYTRDELLKAWKSSWVVDDLLLACMWSTTRRTRKNLAHNHQHSSKHSHASLFFFLSFLLRRSEIDDWRSASDSARRRVRGIKENVHMKLSQMMQKRRKEVQELEKLVIRDVNKKWKERAHTKWSKEIKKHRREKKIRGGGIGKFRNWTDFRLSNIFFDCCMHQWT